VRREGHPDGASRPADTSRAAGASRPADMSRLAGAPISWGVCEVPGWGRQLSPERVLGETAALGLRATELGPAGWLPTEPTALADLLARHGLRLVGGFVPFVLHTSDFEPARAEAERMAALLAAAGAGVVNAAVVADPAWSAPFALDAQQWRHLRGNLARLEHTVAAQGLTLAVHPHAGTLIERVDDVERLLEDTDVGTLSGGERQAVSISRAVYFGAKVLILDEPTSALGVKQSGVVLKYIVQARERGLGVIFITHNPHHAFPVGDRFVILNRGRLQGNWDRSEISRDELVKAMSGGAELDQLTHEIEQQIRRPEAPA
jgi:ABC-type cobalamin transport system ATPase subunit